MRTKSWVVSIAVATGLFATGAIAQHEGHQTEQAVPPADQAGAGHMGGMKSRMQGHMPEMMNGQTDAAKLVDRLLASLTAIEAEKDPAMLKEKLAAHRALLKELEASIQTQSRRMEMMHRMMSGNMQGGSAP